MAFRVRVTPTAKRDANAILEWLVSHDAGEPGLQWFRGLEAAIDSLSNFPARCQLAPEGPSVAIELRQLLYGQRSHVYRILFTIEGETVYVLRIRHGRRKELTLH